MCEIDASPFFGARKNVIKGVALTRARLSEVSEQKRCFQKCENIWSYRPYPFTPPVDAHTLVAELTAAIMSTNGCRGHVLTSTSHVMTVITPKPPPSCPDRLRHLFVAGERCDVETLEWAKASFGVPVLDHWWQTGEKSASFWRLMSSFDALIFISRQIRFCFIAA